MKIIFLLIRHCLIGYFVSSMAAVCSARAASEDGRDEIAIRFLGLWKGEGRAFAMPSKVEMKWESVLNNKFVRLQYKTEMQPPKGDAQIFEGCAFYKFLGKEKYQATWFDSTGDRRPIDAIFVENALTSNWGTPETKVGRTNYRLN